jgi:hypothetical protein
MAEQSTYPIFAEKNYWLVRDKFKLSLPPVVSATYIKALLTLGSDASANNNVITPMKRLGLIDETGKPTQLAKDWRMDDKYKSVCEEIVKKVYSEELLALVSESDSDRLSAVNWFMSSGIGEKTASKMATLFFLLKSGVIKSKEDRTSIPAKKTTPKAKMTSRKGAESNVTPEPALLPSRDEQQAKATGSTNNRPNLHIDLQIHISPESTPEQIETIFASMAKHLYGIDNS